MKNNKITFLFLLISLICFGYGIFLIIQRYKPIPVYTLSQTDPDQQALPAFLEIPKLNINLPIKYAEIIDQKWKFAGEGAYYLTQSPLPGEKGNSIIFGHNWPNIFGSLKKLEKNDELKITFSDGKSKTFVVEDKYIITPDQTHVLNQTDDTRLSIYTCIGFLDSKRLLVLTRPVEN